MFYLMGKPHNGEYVYPCPTNGKCRQLYFENMGFLWVTYPHDYGTIRIEKDTEHGFKTYVGTYKCCTFGDCHKPLTQAVATELNRTLGLELKDIAVDDDFLELLNDF
jgi:hypothetical protein